MFWLGLFCGPIAGSMLLDAVGVPVWLIAILCVLWTTGYTLVAGMTAIRKGEQ